MAPTPEPYRIFNDSLRTESATAYLSTFSSFLCLPPEIRTRIWKECIPAHRFIRVCLDNPLTESLLDLYTSKNELGNIVSGWPYRMNSVGSKEWSPDVLTRVSREASAVFRSVYRVRMPLPVNGSDDSAKSLYICPETDILWINCDNNTRIMPVFVAFLHDLVAYDPKRIGVAHLALGGTNSGEAQELAGINPRDLAPSARDSLVRLLSSSLQTFYPVIEPTMEGRCMLGVMSWPTGQFHHNRSVPIFPATQYYARLERDPREIRADLGHVAVGMDPRRTVYLWNRFKANFGATRNIHVRYILTLLGHQHAGVGSRAEFVNLLQRLDDWMAEWALRLGQRVWGERMTEGEYESQRTSLPQVAGIWSFPPEALGDVPGLSETKYMRTVEWEPKVVKDLSGFVPELWFFNLS